MPDAPAPDRPPSSFKETAISVVIAFVLAFVFRGFVVEAFVIPTGSMAPTLLGAHTRFHSPESGAVWTVNPRDVGQARSGETLPLPIQGENRPLRVTDPMTGARIGEQLPESLGRNKRLLGGDRIFVLKYLYSVYDPSRFDAAVFKYPGRPQENYIKRLVGLPGEEVALVDGDVFVRPAAARAAGATQSDWTANDWTIARKPERVQRALWMPVYDSRYAPLRPERDLRRWFRAPWLGTTGAGETDPAWQIEDRHDYVYSGEGPTVLRWDHENWPVTDRYPYNEIDPLGPNPFGGRFDVNQGMAIFPVCDVRVAFGVRPMRAGPSIAAVLSARGHEFRAELEGDRVTVRMRPVSEGIASEAESWREIGTGRLPRALPAGEVTNLEFWFVDQSVQVWHEGRRVVLAEYAWSPALRVAHATGRPFAEVMRQQRSGNVLADYRLFTPPRVRVEFSGSPVTLSRVRLDRDVHYQASAYDRRHGARGTHVRDGQPALATHPAQPCVLGPHQFFACGDNAASSLDGRLWDTPDPWVAAEFDPTPGVVPRDLLIGKAFFVYFPAVSWEKRAPVPDFGRMRFVW
ncbi:MAG: S26 family signal peptidase [Phycisphaerales bacterium]|nr:S26 family signal peptidase [Phycisphaerales bacterium]